MTERRRSQLYNKALHTTGYAVYRKVFNVSQEFLIEIKDQSKRADRPIFNSRRNDNRRKQCNLKVRKVIIKKFVNNIKTLLQSEYDYLTMSKLVILRSLKDCEE